MLSGVDAVVETSNYLVGADPGKWIKGVPHYQKVKYKDLYPNIDQVIYGTEGRFEYDLIVTPGGDPTQIQFVVDGARSVSLSDRGDLELSLADGALVQRKPVAYQLIEGKRITVDASYIVSGGYQVAFQIATYNRQYELVIDPVIVYSTYLGGTSSRSYGNSIALSRCGEAYIGGYTYATDFPTTTQAINKVGSLSGSYLAFITKLNQAGTAVLYSTYLGVDPNPGIPYTPFSEIVSIAVDQSGHAYVVGNEGSQINFPTTPGNFGAATDTGNFLAKLSADGSSLMYSGYVGGSTMFTAPSWWAYSPLNNVTGVAVDSLGNAYVSGTTLAADFPVTSGAYLTTNAYGPSDTPMAFVSKINPNGSAYVFSTLVGPVVSPWSAGTYNSPITSIGPAIAIDGGNNIYITGSTDALQYPTTPGAYQVTNNSASYNWTFGTDYWSGYITKLNATGSALVYGTFIGGSSADFRPLAISVDATGNAYITGTAAAYSVANPAPDYYGPVVSL